jgi:hypothetical protein
MKVCESKVEATESRAGGVVYVLRREDVDLGINESSDVTVESLVDEREGKGDADEEDRGDGEVG